MVKMAKKEFMIRSDTLDKLREQLEKAAGMITDAIDDKRPILVRHHADCDGYSGAVAFERVILKRLSDVHRRESDIFRYYKRLPSKTPYYCYTDALKDLSVILSDVRRFDHKTPLVIVIDNGSSREDTLALKALKAYDIPVIVVDHHYFEPENDNYIDIHINPLLHDADPYVTAGMISSELAGLIDGSVEGMALLAAVAGIADRSDNDEVQQYISIAAQKGYTRESLAELSEVIDFECFNLGYLESRFFVDDLFFGDIEKQKRFISIVAPEIRKMKDAVLKAVEKYVEVIECDKAVIGKLRVDSVTHTGRYPLRGKTTSLSKDYLTERFKKDAVMLGYGDTFITFRISKGLDLSMHTVKDYLEENFPHAHIIGGGHDKAGTIRFVSAAADELLQKAVEFIRDRI
ncbi:hypothetical protein JXB31_04910 [Candidatus Woesearchaeota archaeon]|nr:hypothetical protein [Candidatus Woesearchaeota archaeon]